MWRKACFDRELLFALNPILSHAALPYMMPYHAQLNVTSAHAVELLLLTADVCTYDYVCT